jgi:hypothetical protein
MRRLGAVLVGVLLLAAPSGVAARTQPAAARSAEGLLTEVEYSGTWTHTYRGSPSGIAANPGTETVTSQLTFTESVSLFTPPTPGGRTLGSGNSQGSPVTVKLSGTKTVTYSPDPGNYSCSVSFSGRSGLKGSQWSISGFGQPLAYISVNEQETKGLVAVYAEAPGLRSSSHPEFVVRRTGGNPSSTDCDPANDPGAPICSGISLINDPEYTPSDRGFGHPPYGFLHAVAKLNPHTPTYSHRYHVNKVLSSCDGTDTVTANSLLIVNNSHASGPSAPAPSTKLTPEEKWKAAARKVKQPALDDLKWSVGFGAAACGPLAAGVGLTTIGTLTLDPVAAGSGAIMTSLASPTAPLCKTLADRIQNDLETIHDPPLRAIHEVARVRVGTVGSLPSCRRWHGRAAAVCSQLRAAATKLLADSERLTGIDTAIAMTVGRGSAATAKRDTGAIALQLGQLRKLSAQHVGALAAEQADAVKVAQVLASAGVDAHLTKTQVGKGIARWLAELAKHGVSISSVKKLAGTALAPASGSFVSSFSGGKVAPPTAARKPSPPPTKPTITSVTFGGSAANPSFVIHGTNLGARPRPSPAAHPSGQNGCPAIAGDDGYDYGTSLYLAVPAKSWAGGRYRPSLNETDCIDLVVTKFTATEVDFHFGPFYAQNHAQFSLDNGDEVEVAVNGATKTVHVKYGATVSS